MAQVWNSSRINISMDSRKIVEVLRATLDANQQQQAHEQLQQVGEVDEKLKDKFSLKTNTWRSVLIF